MLAQCLEYRSNFPSSAALRAKPVFLAAFEIILGCSGEVMVTFRAAVYIADQQGKYKSPGREFVADINFFFSQTGDRLAALQAQNNLSLSRSCLESISPRPCNSMITECIQRSCFTIGTLPF